MYNYYKSYPYPYPYHNNEQMYNLDNMYDVYKPYPSYYDMPVYNTEINNQYTPYEEELNYYSEYVNSNSIHNNFNEFNNSTKLKDYGPQPFVTNINEATKRNNNYRTAIWTGDHLQLTLMSIGVGEDIGLEIHPNIDQFIRIEEGQGIVKMGNMKDKLDFQQKVYDDFAFIIPAGTWHNLINTGNRPIKLYSIYAPPKHPRGTVQKTKKEAEAAE